MGHPVSGYSEQVGRTAEEERQFAADIRAAKDRQLRPMLEEVARKGDAGLVAWGQRGAILDHMVRLGWVRKEVTPNPAGHKIAGLKDRVTFYIEPAGLTQLAGRSWAPR